MRKILIIGATSTIAAATARLWAQTGDNLFLVGRSSEKLQILAQDLRTRGSANVGVYCMDANDINAHENMLSMAEQTLGSIDTVLIAHGSLADQNETQLSVAATLQEIQTNAISVIALLTLIANRFEQQQQKGVIAVISSVAGDRGRKSNYIYGSAKAMLTSFCSGLRQRLYKSGIAVVLIKPGFVDTVMTAQFKKGPLWAKPEAVAQDIVTAVNKGKDVVYTPFFWRYIMLVIKHIPETIFKRLSI